jgi:hypothetical protein
MYFDIWQMLLGVFNRLYNLSTHRTSLTALLTEAQPVAQAGYERCNRLINQAQAFVSYSDNININDPDLVAKLNNYVHVAVPELIFDPLFSSEPATSYENLRVFESCIEVALRLQFEGSRIDKLKEHIRLKEYAEAIALINELKPYVFTAIKDYYAQRQLCGTAINTSISTIVTKYTGIQFVAAICQLVVTIVVTPVSLVMWIMTKLGLEIVVQILRLLTLAIVNLTLFQVNAIIKQIYDADIYDYLASYTTKPLYVRSDFDYTIHMTPDQLESVQLIDVTLL